MFKEIIELFNIKKIISDFLSNQKYKKSFKVDLDNVLKEYDKKFQKVIDEILEEAEKRIVNNTENKDKEITLNLIGNFKSNSLEKLESVFENKSFKSTFKLLFYNGVLKEETENLGVKLDSWYRILKREILNYFNGKEVDLALLKKEKEKIISILSKYFIEIEKDIGEKLITLLPMLVGNNFVKGQGEQNEKIFKNIEVFANDIKKGTMYKYYYKIVKIIDNLFDEIIDLIRK